MNEELWNELLEALTPNVTTFTPTECTLLIKHIMLLSKFIKNNTNTIQVPFINQTDIIPALEKLLGRSFDDTVYLYSPHQFISIIKAPLHNVVENQYKIFYSNHAWLWNPTEGYIIEDCDWDKRIVALVPKIKDPFEKSKLIRDSFSRGIFSYRLFLNNLLSHSDIAVIDSLFDAEKFLGPFQKITPITSWGHIDWEKIQNKTVIGEDPAGIMPALEKLTGTTPNQTVYVEWCDTDLPLISANLGQLLAHYRELTALSLETIIFNLTTPYVIEIDISGTITVGILTGDNA